MFSTLIVARMQPGHAEAVSDIFTAFDATDMPQRMGTRRRELFRYRGLYFHLQDFETPNGTETVEDAKSDPRFIQVSADLRPYIEAYAPDWQSPKDAIAERFYHWKSGQ
ncbi:TcmI family type II polyketide cyclase [Actinocrispum sp. NPDC049592]|uniref:TcmI family type II polyketide cyclase n=1 Tax=Actinocrispum sp. NPDC049592 TaxID=3154835 RepID=UPI00342D638F